MVEYLSEHSDLVAAIVGGLIGVFGSVATIIVSELMKKSGALTVYLDELKIYYMTLTENGSEVQVKDFGEATKVDLNLSFSIYNSSDAPKSLRDLVIEFKQHKDASIFADAKRFVRFEGSGSPYASGIYRNITSVNLPSRELSSLSAHVEYKLGNGESKGSPHADIYLRAKYPDGWPFRKKLTTIRLFGLDS